MTISAPARYALATAMADRRLEQSWLRWWRLRIVTLTGEVAR